MTYAALRVVAALVALLPRAALSWLGGALGVFVGSVLRIRRALVEAAMDRSGVEDPAAAASSMYRALGCGVFELLWLAAGSPARRARAVGDVAIDRAFVEALDDALTRGPVVLFGSHTGNWELAAAAGARLLAARGRRVAVVAKAMSARGVDLFLARLRRRLGVGVIAPLGALAAARRALAEGDVIVTPIDQVPGRASHGVTVDFLGGAALADRAPATLACRARATVLVVAAERDGGEHRVRLLDVIASPSVDDDPRAWVARTTIRATAALEAFVQRTPDAWLWLHRRWRSPEAGPRLVATRQPG
ncbi:MAG: hypothetical protein KF764_18690 [Labilithrix sp.]|nr:hypothetical protein [Labilithrix sp.]